MHTQQGFTIICNSSLLPHPAWFNLELGKSGALWPCLCADLDPVVSSAPPVSLVPTGVGLGVWEDAFQLISFFALSVSNTWIPSLQPAGAVRFVQQDSGVHYLQCKHASFMAF